MNRTFWHKAPAKGWKDGFPIGTGRLGAVVIGDPDTENIVLNHEWLWRGIHQTRDTRPCHQNLEKVRALLSAGRYEEGTILANKSFAGPGGKLEDPDFAKTMGMPPSITRVDPYQPAGNLHFKLDHGTVIDYNRRLDLDTAVVTVNYSTKEAEITCEYLAHPVYDLVMIRIKAFPGLVSGTFWLDRVKDTDCMTLYDLSGSTLILDGMFQDGLDFRIEADLRSKGGKIQNCGENILKVTDAEEILLFLNIGTSARKEAPAAECQKYKIPCSEWSELYKEHVNAYEKIYKRLELDVCVAEIDRPTDERIAAVKNGGSDPGLPLLYFNYGRYLLYASSIHADLPANIQGKWNGDPHPPWGADYHNNVNLQICYWLAEPAHLQEFTRQLFDYIERFIPRARKAARDIYNCRGVLYPHENDPWGRATPESFGYDVWTGGAAWLARHLWDHFQYGQDIEFLRKTAYPFLKEVAAFYQDYLTLDADGILQIIPSQSPENRFAGGGGLPITLCISAAMDVQLASEALTSAIEASKILELDQEDRDIWTDMARRLPKMKIGSKGQLLEWNEEFEEVEPGHRHISHLYGLYPGDQITPDGTPDLCAAARVSLKSRLANATYHPLLWTWVPFIYARLRDGEKAMDAVVDLIVDFPGRTTFRLDPFFGIPAAICEWLLQDYGGILHFLPALPSAWAAGIVRGIRARGGYLVNMEWAQGQLATAEITSVKSRICKIKLDSQGYLVKDAGGNPVSLECRAGEIRFPMEAGMSYHLWKSTE